MEMLEDLIEDEGIEENKAVIQMYKETKLEDCDPSGGITNKYKMLAFKKK